MNSVESLEEEKRLAAILTNIPGVQAFENSVMTRAKAKVKKHKYMDAP